MRFAGFAMLSGDHEAARVSLEEALAFWRSSENPAGLPAVLAGLATVALYQSRFEDSFRLGEESLELYEQRGQRRGVAMILHNLATIEWVLARPDHGRARFERARSILAEIGDRSTEALCLSSLASSRLRCGDLPGAREALRDAFDRLAQIEAPREGIYALDALSELLFMEGRAPESARFAGAAEAARNVLRMPASASERIEIDKVSARVRAELAVEVFERATASGRTLSLEAALTEGRALAASLGSGVT